MALPRYIPHYTLEDFRQWEGDWELWSGVAVSMSPSAKREHQRVSGNLFASLREALGKAGCADCEILFETDWVVSDDTVLRPDLLLTCGHKPSDIVEETPSLIVEVLSESTRQRDLLYKREMYQQLGVTYYVIADPKTRTTQIFFNDSDSFTPSLGPLQLSEDCRLDPDFSEIYP